MSRTAARPGLLRIACAAALALLAVPSAQPAHAGVLPPERDPLVQNLDRTVKPGTDFFRYANGGWVKRNPIPASEARWMIGEVVREEVYQQLLDICRSAAASNAAPGSDEQKVGDFWAVGMDSARTDAQGAEPLQPYFAKIAAVQTRSDLMRVVGEFQLDGFNPLYGLGVYQDERNSDVMRVHLWQGGLGLPDRDYYFNTDSNTVRVRAAYRRHVAAMLRLLGDSPVDAEKGAAQVFALEKSLAQASRKIEQLRDPWANYNKLPFTALDAASPALEWNAQCAAMGIPAPDTVIVGQPEFLHRADSLVKAVPIATWKTYLRWCVVNTLADRLAKPFDQQNFRFYGQTLTGAKTQRPRWKRVLDAEENGIGELLGRTWVSRYCSPATKARYEALTRAILATYRERLLALPWMTEATRKRAVAKLDRVTMKVGYPDHWRDYSSLVMDRSSWAEGQVHVNQWWFRFQAGRLGKPVDRTLWDMTPQTWNAYYNGSNVEIVLPAAAFVIPGLPDSLVDDAMLYGYAGGSTIGHEITHGFDDEGRQSDENGNLNAWWTVQDSVEFMRRADKLVKQYDACVVAGKHVRGRATLGENLADLGGIRLGYEAFKKTDTYRRGEPLNGLTQDQRYFLGYALSWAGSRRPQSVVKQIMTDVHSPETLRVSVPLSNIPECLEAFGIKPGDPMYRPESERAEIW